MLTERYSKHAFGIDLANRSATNRIKRYQNVQIVNRVKTIGKQKKTTMLWFIIEAAWPRHTTSDFVQRSNRETNVELKIGYFIKLIRSAWRTRALAHTQIQAFSITFFKLLEDYSFPREFNWHWLKLVK